MIALPFQARDIVFFAKEDDITGMTADMKPIRRRKLADDVEERVLAIVQRGDLKPGDPLPSERELMAAYGVGRPAIREAMQNLQRSGLVEIRHGERPRVADPSISDMMSRMSTTVVHMLTHSEPTLNHLKEARATFEMELARIASRKRTESDLANLRAILRRQEEASRDPGEFRQCDADFHRCLASISGNPIFVSLIEAILAWLENFHVDLLSRPGLEKLTLREHGEILNAIESGDAEQAAKSMGDHLYRANSLYHTKNLPLNTAS